MANILIKLYSNKVAILLLLTFLQGCMFSLITPIWHGPDEQAHFGQVANHVELGKNLPGKNLNREIYESEVLFGTLRDGTGRNKFTFNPNYQIAYSDSIHGLYEASIAAYPKEFRRDMVISEATIYPPLYYWYSGIFYRLAFEQNLIERVFLTRFGGILLFVLTIFVTYRFGKVLFPNRQLFQLTLSLMVLFQPMLAFVFSTVNSDNLYNLYFSTCLFTGLLLVKNGLRRQHILPLLFLSVVGFLIKPQFVLILPIWFLAVILGFLANTKESEVKIMTKIAVLFGFSLIIFVGILQYFFRVSLFQVMTLLSSSGDGGVTFIEFFKTSIYRTYRETIPWYWGVFNWLGVVLPHIVNRILNYLVVISSIGLCIEIILLSKNRDYKRLGIILYLFGGSALYYLGIICFDFLYANSTGGVSIGVQGRYFFPTIILHMALIIIGFSSLFSQKYRTLGVKSLGVGFVLLSFCGIFTLAKSYYDFSSLNSLFTQLSQYKPTYFKMPQVMILISLYVLLLIVFMKNYLQLRNEKVN